MKEELQQQLFNKYPKIFAQKDMGMQHTLMCWGISCGDGWYNIIDVLCKKIQEKIDRPIDSIEYINHELEKVAHDNNERIESLNNWKAEQENLIMQQVEAVQVKEKYGTLRFYCNISDPAIRNWISFAETMSSVTCEDCGRSGELSGKTWLSTLCELCKVERSSSRSRFLQDSKQLQLKFEE